MTHTEVDPSSKLAPAARGGVVFVAVWCAAMVAASFADAPAARWARASGTASAVAASRWAAWVKAPGTFWFTVAVLAVLWAARRIDGRRVVLVLAVAAFAGLNVVVKWVVGRTRPFKLPEPIADQPRPFELHPFWHGAWGLFHQRDLSFPSGHECTAFALVAGVWLVDRPAAWPLLVLAAAVGVERVAENAHYVSDVVAAVGFAGLGATVARRAMWAWVKRPARLGQF
jgi:membrane-associated phospholipid phosphatase